MIYNIKIWCGIPPQSKTKHLFWHVQEEEEEEEEKEQEEEEEVDFIDNYEISISIPTFIICRSHGYL